MLYIRFISRHVCMNNALMFAGNTKTDLTYHTEQCATNVGSCFAIVLTMQNMGVSIFISVFTQQSTSYSLAHVTSTLSEMVYWLNSLFPFLIRLEHFKI